HSYFKEGFYTRVNEEYSQNYTTNYLETTPRDDFHFIGNIFSNADKCFSEINIRGTSFSEDCTQAPLFLINGDERSILFPQSSNDINSCIGTYIEMSLDPASSYTIFDFKFYDENDNDLGPVASFDFNTNILSIATLPDLRSGTISLIDGNCEIAVNFNINPLYCYPPKDFCDVHVYPNPFLGNSLSIGDLTFDEGRTFENIAELEIVDPFYGSLFQFTPNVQHYTLQNINQYLQNGSVFLIKAKDSSGKECQSLLVK
ncbi:MAG: hypothetical protein MRY83_01850, partial [Flavobacteriales bacterium]|nr:hypothetical protein [Flavobacteriales bacterium]